ncbi:MAG: hypothetical protein M3Z23_03770 [Acidobacteriota bacterium]|nr:hypothetical protein [Acidobacteriota bacterium]
MSPEPNWTANYFNYFTEIEEHFQHARGTSLFLLSPLDWALIESWKNSAVPLEAVLRGIDAAFEKWRGKKQKTQMVNSLAFCAQAVLAEAKRSPESGQPGGSRSQPFPEEDLRRYLAGNADALRQSGLRELTGIADSLDNLAAETHTDFEALEQRLTVMEQRMIAIARARETEEEALISRRELDAQLRPYRGKMTADQLSMLERQYLERRLLESARLPRLSLFYLC